MLAQKVTMIRAKTNPKFPEGISFKPAKKESKMDYFQKFQSDTHFRGNPNSVLHACDNNVLNITMI
jgi:hypothetical protein